MLNSYIFNMYFNVRQRLFFSNSQIIWFDFFFLSFCYLGKGVSTKAGLLLRVTFLNDFASPSGHRAVQQALDDTIWVRGRQLGNVVHGFQTEDLDVLAVTLELHITLKETVSSLGFCDVTG